jgi:hypothetical protein
MFKSIRNNLTLSKVLQLIVLVYQSIAVVVFIAALVFAYNWLQQPFLGAFFEPTMVMSPAGPRSSGEVWGLYAQGARYDDQLLSVSGEEINNANELEQVLDRYFPGETVPVVMKSVEGEETTYAVELHRLPGSDQIAYLFVPAIVSAVFFALSLWIFGLRRSEPAGRAFTVFASSMAIGRGFNRSDSILPARSPLCNGTSLSALGRLFCCPYISGIFYYYNV